MNRVLFSVAALLGALMPLVFDSALKGAALLAVATLCALLLCRASAATRHLVWLVAIVALLVVPVLSVALPQWRVLPGWAVVRAKPVPSGEVRDRAVESDQTRESGTVVAPPLPQTIPANLPPSAEPPPLPAFSTPAVPPDPPRTWREWLAPAWAVGFTILALRLVAAHLLLRRAMRGCVVVAVTPDRSEIDGLAAQFHAACAHLGIRQKVILLLDARRTIPVVWGVFRPRLLLPAESLEWNGEQVRSVLLHELAHIKRRDTLVQWLTQIACALHWWNPLVWLAAWRLHAERERACDDLVLASGVRPSAYAEHLLHVATKLSPARWTAACGLAMARKSSLEGRLLAVLSQKLNRAGITRALTAAALILGTLIAIPLAMLRAADEKWNPPSGAHIGTNDFSAYCVHDGKDAAFVIAYHGFTGSSSAHDSNPKTRTWTDSGTLIAKKPGIALSFHRTHTTPGKLSITVTPAEGRDLSKPAPPPRDFGQKEYDLAKGRVFLLTDAGLVRQFDLPTPVVTDHPSAKKLAALIAAIPPQEREGHIMKPTHKDARALYENWQRLARANGDIPGALVGELAAAVKLFIQYNPTWENVAKLNEILPRLDATRDWKAADVVALLDEMGAIKDAPLDMASWNQRPLRKGEKLPEKFADAEWSGAGGLRVAWMLEPGAAEHRIGAALKARLLVWNTGAVPVMLQVPTWHQGGVTATDAKGAAVEVSGIEWTTLPFSQPACLGPGEFFEINAPGVGLGKDAGRGPWAGPRVGSNVFAKPGDDITLTHSPVPLDGSEEGIRDGVPPVVGAGWWMKHIKARLSRELPLPAGAAERTHLLDRAVRELFAAAPTAEEIAAFTADQTPGALDALAKRLAERPDAAEFAGKLSPAPVKFRVLAADAAAAGRPRVVLGPGGYPIGEGSVSLKIVGRPVGDRRTNDAELVFVSKEPGIPRASTHKLELPDGWGTWAIVCRPGEGFFYVLHKGTARKIDYTKPRQVTDTPATDLPVEFRAEVKRQFDIAGVSSESQAAVFEKPAPPAPTPAPTSAEASSRADGAQLRPKHETAQALFKNWKASARTDGKIPGALIGQLAEQVANFMKQYPRNVLDTRRFAAASAKLDASRDWPQAEVVAVLDEIAGMVTTPLEWANLPMEFDAGRNVRRGEALPKELESAAWGAPVKNGLRAAWLLEPRAEQYAAGTVLKARVLFHNTGKAPVVFQTETWHQHDGHKARDAKGAEISVKATWFTGITPMATFRLASGEYCEVSGHGIAIGAGEHKEEHSTGAVGAIIEAKVGDMVTLSHTVDANQDGWTKPDEPKGPAELRKHIIAERVHREAPLPSAAADRELLIRRVTLDLTGVAPSAEEIAAFTADDAPDALANLIARLQAKSAEAPWSGKLPTGETKFRVIAADPNAAKAPRTANAPGRYVLGDGVHLQVRQVTEAGQRTNSAEIIFLSPDPKVASPHKPHNIALPDGLGTYGIVWERGTGVLWTLGQKGLVRKYDFTNPDAVKESRFESGGIINIPEHLREPMKKAFDVPGAPERKQMPVEPKDGAAAPTAPAGEFVFITSDGPLPAEPLATGDGVTLELKRITFPPGKKRVATPPGGKPATHSGVYAILRWPARDGQPALEHGEQIVSDTLENPGKWAAAWQPGTKTVWLARRDSTLPRPGFIEMTFPDSKQITVKHIGVNSKDSLLPPAMPAGFRAKFGAFFDIAVPSGTGQPEYYETEQVHAAVQEDKKLHPGATFASELITNPGTAEWRVKFEHGDTGKSVTEVLARLTIMDADGSKRQTMLRTWKAGEWFHINFGADGVLKVVLTGKQYASIIVEDEKLTPGGVPVSYFGNVPDSVSAGVKHTNLQEPYVVKLWPRTAKKAVVNLFPMDDVALEVEMDKPEGLRGPAKLKPATEKSLAWGETVNGLRAALVRMPPEKELTAGMVADFNVVVQNVSGAPVKLRGESPVNASLKVERVGEGGVKEYQSTMDAQSPIGEFVLQPREVAALSLMSVGFGERDPNEASARGRAIAYRIPATKGVARITAGVVFNIAPAGYWSGTLNAPYVVQTAVPAATKLDPNTEAQLDWGDAVNGLRGAVVIRGEPQGIYLAVQNVSPAPLRFTDTVKAKDLRKLYLSDSEGILMALTSDEPTQTDVLLQPREVAYLRMIPPLKEGEYCPEAGLIEGIRKDALQTWMIVLQIATAPEGAWKGKLITADTRCALREGGPQPKNASAQALFKRWQNNARLNGDIPGGLVRLLHEKVKEFIRANEPDASGGPFAQKMKPLEPRFANAGDWKAADVVALLDDIAAAHTIPLDNALTHLSERTLYPGTPLPASLEKADWGEPLPSGLRVAHLLEPRAGAYHLGTELKARIIFHNTGSQHVEFITDTFQQPGHSAKRADGSDIKLDATRWLTEGSMAAYRLAPGEYCEVHTPGLGIGARVKDREDWENVRAGSWILCAAGDEVVFTPGAAALSYHETPGQKADWWLEFITERLNREAPVPADTKEREYLLYRVVRELFGTAPSTTEGDAFAADKSPDALKNLAALLAKHPYGKRSDGVIQAGSTKFRVLPPDADADKRPRVATGAGMFSLGDGVNFYVTQRAASNRVRNDASIVYYQQGKDAVVHKVPLPYGHDKWAAATMKGAKELWVAEFGTLRKYDFANPHQPVETRYEAGKLSDAPISKELRAALDPVLSKPAVAPAPKNPGPPPASAPATEKPKGAALTPAELQKRYYAAREKRGEPLPVGVGSRAVLIRSLTLDITGEPPTQEERNAFEADGAPDALGKVIARLVAKAGKLPPGLLDAAQDTTKPEPPKSAAAKLTPDTLLGMWRGTVNEEKLMLSFHRPPVEKDVRLDIYFGEATIGVPTRFTIATDGRSAEVVQHSAGGGMKFGTLIPGEAGKLKLELFGRQKGQQEVTLTRDAEPAATAPRQAEARELFEMWKTTANDDGTIPGTFIGALATEVRAYVKAKPNYDSAMKLPKLLPRFVTSRDWTQAEAIKLLDDVAYYATEPIAARVAKAKLPSGPLWRTMVEFQDIPVAIAKWSEAKDGLRIGMRVVDADWRIGGKARMELWLHNVGGKDVSFRTAGPNRQDVELSFSAIDAEGNEHRPEHNPLNIFAPLLDCTLPAGHVAMAKEFDVTFADVDHDVSTRMGHWFRDLKPGKYQLRCKWFGAKLEPAKSDKHIELTAPELDFTLVAQDAPQTAAQRELPPVDGQPARPKLADDRYAKSGVPLAEQTWPMPPWGAEKDGLSAGLRVIDDARIGGEVKAELWVRNSSAKDVKFSQCLRADVGLSVEAKDKDGKEHSADITSFRGKPGFSHLLLPSGHIVKVKEFNVKFGAGKNDKLEPGWVNLQLTPGDYKLRAVWSDTTSMAAPEGEWTGKVTTGEVAFKLAAANAGADAGKPAAKPPGANIVTVPDDQYVKSGSPKDELVGEGVMWNDAQNGLSLGYRITGDEWRILGKELKVELWVQNPGDKDVKFQLNMRPDIGLRMKLKGEKGEEHESNIVPTDVPPFGELRLLPPGHALKVKEFTVSLLWPENDVSGIKGHYFAIDPGAYNFHCELELPGFSATGAGGKQLTPAAGEWTGKLTTRGLNVVVVAPDAPAPKPRVEHVRVRISKDGEVSLDRKKMSLDELKTRAARNAKKWFTIEADEDVPYAKVIEVVEALKAVGVTEFSFSEARVGDGKYRVANRTGNYEFDGKRKFSICRPDERQQWFTVNWPAEGNWSRGWLRFFPNVSGQARGKWAVVWEPGTDVLWWVDDSDVGKMTLTDPAHIIVDREGRKNNFSRDFGLPEEVKTEFRRLGFVIGREPVDGRVPIGGNTGGQSIVSAEFGMWSIVGTVTDVDGKPLANVPVRVTTNQELQTAKTDEKGNYRVYFSLPLQLLAHWRAVTVAPVLEGFTERDMAKAGQFNALLHAGEQPQRVRIAGDKDFQPGPIPRLAANDLIPGQQGVVQPASGRADFVMLTAGEITGEIVTADGKPAPPHFVAAATPEQRPGHNAAIQLSDDKGHFRLNGIPTNKPVIFTVNPDGKPGETSKSSEQKFEQTGEHKIRIVLPAEGSGKGAVKIERLADGESTVPLPKPAAVSKEPIVLKFAAAADLSDAVKKKYGPTAASAILSVDNRANALTIDASHPDAAKVRELIATLDQRDAPVAPMKGSLIVRAQGVWSEEWQALSKVIAESRELADWKPDDVIAWGPEGDGLRSGMLIPQRAKLGDTVKPLLVLRNVSGATKELKVCTSLNVLTPSVRSADGKTTMKVRKVTLHGGDALIPVMLKGGEQFEYAGPPVQFGVERDAKGIPLIPEFPTAGVVTGAETLLLKFSLLNVRGPETGEFSIQVAAPNAMIRGKVLKPDGTAAAGVQVRVDDGVERWKFHGEGISDLPKTVKTADDGTFSIEVPKHSVATNYEAFASSDEFAPLNAKVPAGGDVGVMQFAKGSTVTGRVIGLDGAGLVKVGIWCKQLDWHGRGPAPSKLTSTGADGTFSIPSIATGKYLLVVLTRDLGAKELAVAFANPVIETKDDAPVAVEIRPLPTVDLTFDVQVRRGKVEFPDFELRVSGTLPGHKAGEPAAFWTRQETTKLTAGKHTIAVPAGLQNATARADRIYMRKGDEPVFIWRCEGDEKRVVNNTLELGLADKPQSIGLTVQDATK